MKGVSAQDLASYAAVIVACVALYVGWDQAQIGRNQQHADVFPVLQFTGALGGKKDENGDWIRTLSLSMKNEGVGPAFVENVSWTVSDLKISHSSEVKQVFPDGLNAVYEYQGEYEHILVGAGEKREIWNVEWQYNEQNRPKIDAFMEMFWKMKLDVCYCSLYERCWVSSYLAKTARPHRVDSCPVLSDS